MIRPALKPDIHRVFRWRNLPEIVELGSQNKRVSRQEHESWFAKCLRKEILLYIIEPKLGTVRLDRNNETAEISIYLIDGKRRGRGTQAIKDATKKAFKTWDVKEVVAYIKTGNEASERAFKSAGYHQEPCNDGVCMVKG